MTRSGTRELEIDINTYSFKNLSDIFLRHAPRISRLKFACLFSDDMLHFFHVFSTLNAPLSSLQEVGIWGEVADKVLGIGGGIFKSSPQLRKIDIGLGKRLPETLPLHRIMLHLQAPLGTLTTLCLRDQLTFQRISSLLTEIPNLETCAFTVNHSRQPPALPEITIPHLQSLKITDNSLSLEPEYLRYLNLPALRELNLELEAFGDIDSAIRFSLVDSSRCQLESLKLNCGYDLAPILEVMHHSLRSLNAPYACLSTSVMRLIANGEYEPRFLQDAQFLILPKDFEELVSMLESVCPGMEGASIKWNTKILVSGGRYLYDLKERFDEVRSRFSIMKNMVLSFPRVLYEGEVESNY
jgi:hypothetical protein